MKRSKKNGPLETTELHPPGGGHDWHLTDSGFDTRTQALRFSYECRTCRSIAVYTKDGEEESWAFAPRGGTFSSDLPGCGRHPAGEAAERHYEDFCTAFWAVLDPHRERWPEIERNLRYPEGHIARLRMGEGAIDVATALHAFQTLGVDPGQFFQDLYGGAQGEAMAT